MFGEFSVEKPMTNVRVVKEEGYSVVVVSTTGQFRLTDKAGVALGVDDTSRIAIVSIKTGDGEVLPALYVSPYGHQRGEDGKFIEGEDGKLAYFEVRDMCATPMFNQKGQKLAYNNGVSGSLQFSSKSAWLDLNGAKDTTTVWDILALDPENEEGKDWMGEQEGRTFYGLQKGEVVVKAAKVEGNEGEEITETLGNAPEDAPEDVPEEG